MTVLEQKQATSTPFKVLFRVRFFSPLNSRYKIISIAMLNMAKPNDTLITY
jgi:hypothetical protein